jgi:outer membrane receptor for monomeric catechols
MGSSDVISTMAGENLAPVEENRCHVGKSSNSLRKLLFLDWEVFNTDSSNHRETQAAPNRVAQTAFLLFSTFLDLRPVSDASD